MKTEKNSLLGATSVRAPILLEQFQKNGFNLGHENICPFISDIVSSISTFRDMYIHLTMWKKKFFSMLFSRKLFFFLQYLNSEAWWKRFGQKIKVKKEFFFQLWSFVDKTTFNFHSFNKINDFVNSQLLLNMLLQCFIHFN